MAVFDKSFQSIQDNRIKSKMHSNALVDPYILAILKLEMLRAGQICVGKIVTRLFLYVLKLSTDIN